MKSKQLTDEELANIYDIYVGWHEEQDCYIVVARLLAQIKWWKEWHDHLINK